MTLPEDPAPENVVPENLTASPRLPLDRDGGPVFNAPWEARVFAMTVQAHQAGLFSWSEWAEALGAELAQDGKKPGKGSDGGERGYYDHWLAAFEKLLTASGIADPDQLADLRNAWDRAARSTPHGQPIELEKV